MARSRSIKPGFFEDTDIAELSIEARYLYIGLWTLMDRQGICENDPKLIKRAIFGYDKNITIPRLIRLVNELISHWFIVSFSHGNKDLLHCPTFLKHQHFHRDERPKYMIPDDILMTHLQHRTGTVQARFNASASTPVICNLLSVIEAPGFDFEILYKKYPRKINPSEAKKRFSQVIKTKEDFEKLSIAIDRYSAYCLKEKTEPRYIKHFSTFLEDRESKPYVQHWRDWLDPETGNALNTPKQKLSPFAQEIMKRNGEV